MVRNFLAKSPWGTAFVRLITPKCKACWMCLDVCPSKVFGKVGFPWRHARMARPGDCTGCMKCVKACPFNAIVSVGKK